MNRRNAHNRRGAAVILALVCLTMAAMLMAVMARVALTTSQQARDEGRRLQAAWLVESGLQRAGAQLAADSDYAGETWTIPASVLGTGHDAVVLIEVRASDAEPQQRTVRVRADYPDDPVHRVRKSKQLVVELVLPEEAPAGDQPTTQ